MNQPIDNDRLIKRLESIGVPKRYLSARLSDFDCEIPAHGDHGLFIMGPPGVGKSHLAAAILAHQLPLIFSRDDRGTVQPNALWVSAPWFLLELRNTFSSGCEDTTEMQIIQRYLEEHLLVLDDVGAEKATDWTSQSMYTLIAGRIDKCLPTIVTSNFRLSEIHEHDPRLASRLGGMNYYRLGGKDRRLKNVADEGNQTQDGLRN